MGRLKRLAVGLAAIGLLCYFSLGACDAVQVPPLKFGPHPRLLYTPADVAAWRADPKRQGQIKSIAASADRLLKKPLYVPDKGGQWIFYYSCPKDNCALQPLSLTEHVCPRCKKKFTDARTVAAYRTVLQNTLNSECNRLALAYALTGDDKYAAPVRTALLTLADYFPHYERHDRWGRKGIMAVVGGRRYCQNLSEAVGAISLAKAYDLIYNSKVLSAADRKKIEDDFLGATVREILRLASFAGGRNNHQTWFNASFTVVGVAIGDEFLVKSGVYGNHGLMWQLGASITKDGLWYEGTIAYHFYALQAIKETVEAARRVGWDIKDPRLEKMFLAPLQLAYPNGQFPAINDGDYATLRGYQGFYRWAYEYFGNPVFLPYSGLKTDRVAPQPESTVLADAGLVTLRRGAGDAALCALVDYGIHGDHHGHPDKLNLMLYGLGRELLLDPGRLSYRVPEYETWARTTVAHNTVVINGRGQFPTTGSLGHFAATHDCVAALTVGGRAYPGWDLRRFVLLTDRLLVDVFAVSGPKPAQLDWFLHVRGQMKTDLPLKDRPQPLGTQSGYQHLTRLRQASGADRIVIDMDQGKDKLLRIHLLGDAASTLVTGNGIGYGLKDFVPFILRRRTAQSTLFVTVYDLSGDGAGVKALTPVPVLLDGKPLPRTAAVGLRIDTPAGPVLLALDLRDKPTGATTLDGLPFTRLLFRPARK